MKLRWTRTAFRDLLSLHAYIVKENPGAAGATVDRLLNAIAAVQDQPEIGRQGRVSGTRELIVSPCIVAYRTRKKVVEVVAIVHGARRWPESF